MSTNAPSPPEERSERRCTALCVDRGPDGQLVRRWTDVNVADLPPHDTLIDVQWSSLNYKDALAASGHAGVARRLPHVPGIDAAGVVIESSGPWRPGDQVLVTGYELGSGQWGGWSEMVRVPSEWVVPLPAGLTAQQAMTLGTAGLTAAQCVRELIHDHVQAGDGQVVVTGATGGVGNFVVQILASLGYEVVAVTGKADAHDWLRQLGAASVLDRHALDAPADRPLLSARWAGAVDTVGGATLTTLVRSVRPHGCVAACGLVGGVDLHLTVHPFILRGVKLAGITSALCPHPVRLELWSALAGPWRPQHLDQVGEVIERDKLEASIAAILAGEVRGRRVLRVRSNVSPRR